MFFGFLSSLCLFVPLFSSFFCSLESFFFFFLGFSLFFSFIFFFFYFFFFFFFFSPSLFFPFLFSFSYPFSSGTQPVKRGSVPSPPATTEEPTVSLLSTTSPTKSPSTTSNNGCKRSTDMRARTSTSSLLVTSAIWPTRELLSTTPPRSLLPASPSPFPSLRPVPRTPPTLRGLS